jgi:hypothetical protein
MRGMKVAVGGVNQNKPRRNGRNLRDQAGGSHSIAVVKSTVLSNFEESLSTFLQSVMDADIDVHGLEKSLWSVAIALGRELFGAILGLRCFQMAYQWVCAAPMGLPNEGHPAGDVRFRLDNDHTAKLNTTFDPMRFHRFALRKPDGKTWIPARALLPHYRKIRSSDMLVEWEAALAVDYPFRQVGEALLFYSHGAADVEDTTIQRHAVALGGLVSQEWMYRSADDIREILTTRATRDLHTKGPLICASTDAHALHRFVDEIWNAKWKMTHGIRVWCIDKDTGNTIHIGGEFT